MKRIPDLLFLLASLLPFACGCGSGQPLGTVTGTVSYQGEPIKSGTIVFEVDGARPATGKIVDGRITEVTTEVTGDGVPLGNAKIAVFATDAPQEPAGETPAATDPGTQADMSNYMGMGAKSIIPPHFNDPASSGLSAEITKGENTVTLDLTE